MAVLPYIESQCTKFHTAGSMWGFTASYLESCIWPHLILRWIRKGTASNFVQITEKVWRGTIVIIRQWFNVDSVSHTRKARKRWDIWRGKSRECSSFASTWRGLFTKKILPGGQKTQFHILLWRFTATVWKYTKTSPRILTTKNCLLHQANALSHISLFDRKYFTKNNMTLIPHPTFICFPNWR
jgi:hypothetical protein